MTDREGSSDASAIRPASWHGARLRGHNKARSLILVLARFGAWIPATRVALLATRLRFEARRPTGVWRASIHTTPDHEETWQPALPRHGVGSSETGCSETRCSAWTWRCLCPQRSGPA